MSRINLRQALERPPFLSLATLALAVLSPIAASAKVWVDPTCTHIVITDGGARLFYQKDGAGLVTCTIRDWPISRPNALLWCGVGNDNITAEWPDDSTLLWNGNKLMLYTGPLPCPPEEPD